MLEENEQFEISGDEHYQCCCHLTGAQDPTPKAITATPKDRTVLQSHH